MSDRWKDEAQEERRQAEDIGGVQSRLIEPEVEKDLVEKGQFSLSLLYNRRGGLQERGLAGLLEQGDQIVEITPGIATVRTREGTLQTFWDLNREHVFIRKLTDEERAALEDEERESMGLSATPADSGD